MKPSLHIRSLLLSCIFAATSANSFATATIITSPDKQFSVRKVCNHKTQECSFFAGKKAIEKNLPEDRTSYEWLGNTFALRTSFGSYDSYTTFADRTHKPHTLSSVIATDSKTQCAVTADNKEVCRSTRCSATNPSNSLLQTIKNSASLKMLPRWNPSSKQSSKARKSV